MTSLDYNETTFFSNQSINNSNITSMSHIRSKSNEKTIDLVYKFNEDSKSLPKISNKIRNINRYPLFYHFHVIS